MVRDDVAWIRPEAVRATYEQGECRVRSAGGPNPNVVQSVGMTCV